MEHCKLTNFLNMKWIILLRDWVILLEEVQEFQMRNFINQEQNFQFRAMVCTFAIMEVELGLELVLKDGGS